MDGVLEKNVENPPLYVSQSNGFKSMALKRQSTLKNAVQVVVVIAIEPERVEIGQVEAVAGWRVMKATFNLLQ